MAESAANVEYEVKLPFHGTGFRRIKRVISIDADSMTVVAEDDYQGDEKLDLSHHFTSGPMLPGTLFPEAMAEAAAQLVQARPDLQGYNFYLAGIDKARFGRPVMPGSTIRYTSTVTELNLHHRLGKIKSTAEVDGKVVAKAELLFSMIPTASLPK